MSQETDGYPESNPPNILIRIVAVIVIILLFFAMLTGWETINIPGF